MFQTTNQLSLYIFILYAISRSISAYFLLDFSQWLKCQITQITHHGASALKRSLESWIVLFLNMYCVVLVIDVLIGQIAKPVNHSEPASTCQVSSAVPQYEANEAEMLAYWWNMWKLILWHSIGSHCEWFPKNTRMNRQILRPFWDFPLQAYIQTCILSKILVRY